MMGRTYTDYDRNLARSHENYDPSIDPSGALGRRIADKIINVAQRYHISPSRFVEEAIASESQQNLFNTPKKSARARRETPEPVYTREKLEEFRRIAHSPFMELGVGELRSPGDYKDKLSALRRAGYKFRQPYSHLKKRELADLLLETQNDLGRRLRDFH
jgi:hypothetical protein